MKIFTNKEVTKHIIVATISIAVTIIVAVFLLNQEPDFIKILGDNNEALILTPGQNIAKNIVISIFMGGSIYAVFYVGPHEYKIANQKRENKKDE